MLSDAGALDWAAQLASFAGEPQKTTQTVRMYMTRALGFLFDPALAASVLPTEEHPALDLDSFVRQPNTLYLIASARASSRRWRRCSQRWPTRSTTRPGWPAAGRPAAVCPARC